jgi:coproporphyrinogen III oxidase-like Fe-S oxidoreductase
VKEEEWLTPTQRAEELLLLGLRTAAGMDLERFRTAVGVALPALAGEALVEAQANGLVEIEAGRLRVPEARWGVLHSIVARLLAGMDFRQVGDVARPAPPARRESVPAGPPTSG